MREDIVPGVYWFWISDREGRVVPPTVAVVKRLWRAPGHVDPPLTLDGNLDVDEMKRRCGEDVYTAFCLPDVLVQWLDLATFDRLEAWKKIEPPGA